MMTGDDLFSTPSPARLAARSRRAAGTATDFDGDRLGLARRLARMPRTALAEHCGVTASAITQFERGQARPTAPVLAQLSLTLGVPGDFFRIGAPLQPIAASAAHFRSLRATPALVRDQAVAFAELALTIIDVIEQHVDFPTVDLPEVPVLTGADVGDVAAAARATRTHLGVPTGPVGHVVQLLEAHGVMILGLTETLTDRRVDAFSTQAPRRPMILLSPMKDDKARSRFDAAHELGHLVMHHDTEPGSRLVEAQAQSFAAEFLMPADQIAADLPRRVDWHQLHAAKRKWGTSLRALAYRAHTLGIWSDGSYRRANMELAQQGNPEPGPLGPAEAPSLLGRAALLLAEHGIDTAQIAALCRLPEHLVTDIIDAGSTPRLSLANPASAGVF